MEIGPPTNHGTAIGLGLRFRNSASISTSNRKFPFLIRSSARGLADIGTASFRLVYEEREHCPASCHLFILSVRKEIDLC